MIYMYHKEHGKKLFNDDEDIGALEKDGWVDSPAKITEEDPKPKRTRKVKDDSEKDN